MQVASGKVSDRPFARTVYTIAVKRFTGDLIMTAAGRDYKLSWEDGRVVAAKSSAAADSAARVALSAQLVSSSHVSRALDEMAKAPDRDPVDILAELARLSTQQIGRLKRRLLASHAMRIFALPDGSFVLDNARSMRADPDIPPIDPRWLIYNGLKTHYSLERLDAELGQLAERPLTLAADAQRFLGAFGFADAEKPVLDRLAARAWTLHQLSRASTADPRLVRTVMYALVACDCLEQGARVADEPVAAVEPASSAPIATGSSIPADARSSIDARLRAKRRSTRPPDSQEKASLAQGTVKRLDFPGSRSTIPGNTKFVTVTDPPRSSAPSPAPVGKPESRRRSSPTTRPPSTDNEAAVETRTLIADKVKQLDAGADHFALLGIGRGAASGEVRTAYFALAKRLHPDRLRAVGVFDMDKDAQRLFAHINQAFSTLGDSKRRAEYVRVLAAGGQKQLEQAEADAGEQAARILKAEESYRLGEMALRRSQFEQARDLFEQAAELNPDEAEYQALLAWSTWVCAADKVSVALAVNKRLTDALATSPRCVPAHFYFGKIAKQSGRQDAAMQSFRKVVELEPDHSEAQLELRLLARRGTDSKRGGSLLDRLKKR